MDTLGSPCALFVYRSTEVQHYIETAKITAEFCEEAIALIERDGSVYMIWSG